jgi:hypothetical protein
MVVESTEKVLNVVSAVQVAQMRYSRAQPASLTFVEATRAPFIGRRIFCLAMVRPPNYRLAASEADPNPKSACIDCRYVADNRCHAYCVKYSTRVNPWYVCDEWKRR